MINSLITKYKKIPLAAKASVWFVLCNILQKGIQFITIPVFTRMMNTEQYGLNNIYQSAFDLLLVFSSLELYYGQFNVGLTRFEEDKENYTSSCFGLSMTISVIVCSLYFIFKNSLNSIFQLPSILIDTMMFELIITPSLLFWSVRQRYEYKYILLVILTLSMSVLTPAAGIVSIHMFSEKGTARIISAALVKGLFCIPLMFVILKKGKHFFNKKYWKYALFFNLPLIPHYLSQTALSQCDRIMINKFFNASVTGIYSIGYSVGFLLNLFTNAINNSMIPWTYQKLKKNMYEDISSFTNALLVLISGISIMLTIFAPEIVSILAPKEYSDTIWVIPPVVISVYFIFLYCIFGNIEFYFEERKYAAAASISGAVLNVILNYIFIPVYGFIAAGYTTLICYIAYSVFHYICYRKTCSKYINGQKIYNGNIVFIISVITIILNLSIMLVYKHIVIRYIIVLLIGAAAVLNRNRIKNIVKSLFVK